MHRGSLRGARHNQLQRKQRHHLPHRRVRNRTTDTGRYLQAAEALAQADQAWLGRLITRRTRLEDFAQAFEQRDDDVKVVIDLQQE